MLGWAQQGPKDICQRKENLLSTQSLQQKMLLSLITTQSTSCRFIFVWQSLSKLKNHKKEVSQ